MGVKRDGKPCLPWAGWMTPSIKVLMGGLNVNWCLGQYGDCRAFPWGARRTPGDEIALAVAEYPRHPPPKRPDEPGSPSRRAE